MNHERIKTLIDCYGADTENWPREELESAIRLLDASPELITYQDNARVLDKLLATQPASENITTTTLANRIMGNLPAQEHTKQPKHRYFSFAAAAAIALVFVTTWLLQPATIDVPFSETTELAQTEFEQWAWEETLDQTPLALLDNDESTVEWPFMEI